MHTPELLSPKLTPAEFCRTPIRVAIAMAYSRYGTTLPPIQEILDVDTPFELSDVHASVNLALANFIASLSARIPELEAFLASGKTGYSILAGASFGRLLPSKSSATGFTSDDSLASVTLSVTLEGRSEEENSVEQTGLELLGNVLKRLETRLFARGINLKIALPGHEPHMTATEPILVVTNSLSPPVSVTAIEAVPPGDEVAVIDHFSILGEDVAAAPPTKPAKRIRKTATGTTPERKPRRRKSVVTREGTTPQKKRTAKPVGSSATSSATAVPAS